MSLTKEEKEKMTLLVKTTGNWSYYLDSKLNAVFSIANDGTKGADTIFGNILYFKRWLKNEMKINPEIKKGVTSEGFKILEGNEFK